MNAQTYRHLVALVDAALDLDPSAREAFLDRACADQPELRAEVVSLLEEERSALGGDFLRVPAGLRALELLVEARRGARPAPDDDPR